MSEINDTDDTFLRLKRSTNIRLQGVKNRMGYPSVDALLCAFLDLRTKLKLLSRLDFETIITYGKLPEIITGTASGEDQMYHDLDLDKPSAHKTFSATIKVEPKPEKTEPTDTKVQKMPSSTEFFKGKAS